MIDVVKKMGRFFRLLNAARVFLLPTKVTHLPIPVLWNILASTWIFISIYIHKFEFIYKMAAPTKEHTITFLYIL